MAAYGGEFWVGEEMGWNIFETFLVVIAILEVILAEIGAKGGVVKGMRILRMARCLRVVRLFHALHQLRVLVESVMMIIGPLMWSIFVLTAWIFVFGIIFLNGIAD